MAFGITSQSELSVAKKVHWNYRLRLSCIDMRVNEVNKVSFLYLVHIKSRILTFLKHLIDLCLENQIFLKIYIVCNCKSNNLH